LFFATTSQLISQGTTGYQWPTLTDGGTYWWRVWAENKLGVISPIVTVLGQGGVAKLGFETELSVDILLSQYNFGEVALGVSTQTTIVIQVKNDGNIPESFALRCGTNTVGSPWFTIETSSGADNYLLRAVFHPTRPNMTDFADPLTPGDDIVSDNEYRISSTTVTGGRYTVNDTETGVSVGAGVTKNLWIRLDMPLTSGTAASQEIILYIRAESP